MRKAKLVGVSCGANYKLRPMATDQKVSKIEERLKLFVPNQRSR